MRLKTTRQIVDNLVWFCARPLGMYGVGVCRDEATGTIVTTHDDDDSDDEGC